jgi:hypothetical protein
VAYPISTCSFGRVEVVLDPKAGSMKQAKEKAASAKKKRKSDKEEEKKPEPPTSSKAGGGRTTPLANRLQEAAPTTPEGKEESIS